MEDSQPNLVLIENSTTFIPLDLTLQILSKLPARSLIRFQFVSKLWFSIIRSKDFTNSFLTRSRTQPRLLFTFKHFDSRKRFIFSAPEHNNNDDDDDDKSSTVIASHDMTISDLVYYIKSRPVNGLICCTRGSSIAVCNPTTRQIVKLPDVTPNGRGMYARLGYDPVEDQYKVLCVMMFDGYNGTEHNLEQEHFVFTLRSGQREWRKIEFIQGPEDYNAVSCYSTLINYQGKLAGLSYDFYCVYEMGLWVLQDVEKQEWLSVMKCAVPSEWGDLFSKERFLCTGEIHTNEVMLVSRSLESSKHFCVYYCDLVRESIRRCEVDGIADSEFRRLHGIGKHSREMLCFPGHVENIIFF